MRLQRAVGKAGRLFSLARDGGWRVAAKEARKNLWSDKQAYGLRYDLAVLPDTSQLPPDITIRRLQPTDVADILAPDWGDSPKQLARQRRLVDAGIGTCWVAVNADDKPMFMQWMIGPEDNEAMRRTLGSEFPSLPADEVLMEGAFAPKRHRGSAAALVGALLIIGQAPPQARSVLTFIATDNRALIEATTLVGFQPVMLRHSRWRLGWHSTSFEPIPEGDFLNL